MPLGLIFTDASLCF